MTSQTTPTLDIRVGGRAMASPDRLRAVRVVSQLSRPTQCDLVIDLGAGDHPWPAEWAFGTPLAVCDDRARELFAGEVTAVELRHGPAGSAEVRVRAYDPLHRLRKRQQPQVFEEVTPADIVARLTADLGLELVVDEPGPRLDRVVQHRQSDFELLVDVIGEAGLHLALRGQTLRLMTLAGYDPPVALRRGTSLWDLRIEANLDRVARTVTALGWHSQHAETLTGSAGPPRCAPGPVDLDPGAVGAAGRRVLIDRPVRNGSQLAAIAQANLDASMHRATTVEGSADGDHQLWAGRRVTIVDSGGATVGECVPTTVVHTVDAGGYQTWFSTALDPAPATGGSGPAMTLGHVTDVDDPERLGRVRVSLPSHGDVDAGWLPVLHPGAGPDRGLMILPDAGDTVLVALPRHTPADGVVLGALYGTVTPPDSGVDGGAVRRWSMRTPAGQSVVIDDAKRTVSVENHAGSRIELGPERMRLHASTDLVIEAPGRQLTVRARTVDFERAG